METDIILKDCNGKPNCFFHYKMTITKKTLIILCGHLWDMLKMRKKGLWIINAQYPCSQLTATMGSTERMSVFPERACLAVNSTCVSLWLCESLEEPWLCCEEAWPEWDRGCLGLEASRLSGQAVLLRGTHAAAGRSSGSNPTTVLRLLLHMSKRRRSSWQKAGFRQQ